jgi:hypothetical protein
MDSRNTAREALKMIPIQTSMELQDVCHLLPDGRRHLARYTDCKCKSGHSYFNLYVFRYTVVWFEVEIVSE